MIRFVWRSDVHLSDKAPASRKDDWVETVLGKLRQTILAANKIEAAAIIDGGDFFHIKSPGRTSHHLIHRVAELHKQANCPIYANVGNHDCIYGDIDYLDQQPLGVLFTTGVFKRLYGEHEAVFTEFLGGGHMGEPTKQLKVRFVGIPYQGTVYDTSWFDHIERGDEDYLVVVAHLLASYDGGSMFGAEDVIKYETLLDHPADVFMFGHWHKDQGVVVMEGVDEEAGKEKVFVNVGSMTRGSLSDDEVKREPSIAVLDFTPEGVRATPVKLKVAPVEEVFDVERRKQVETRFSSIDSFVSSLKTEISGEDKPSIQEAVEGMDLPDKVREQALLYLEQAG
jgi:DNA repair exonuclease SbcCD nuclease subunit